MGNSNGKRKALLFYNQHPGSEEKNTSNPKREMFNAYRQALIIAAYPRSLAAGIFLCLSK